MGVDGTSIVLLMAVLAGVAAEPGVVTVAGGVFMWLFACIISSWCGPSSCCRVSMSSMGVPDALAADVEADAEAEAEVEAGAKALTKRVPWCLDLDMTIPLRVETRAPLWTVALNCLSIGGIEFRGSGPSPSSGVRVGSGH